MIVPFAKGQAKGQPAQQAQPSETDMLMALATMHSMGRIAQNDSLPSDWEKTWQESIPFGGNAGNNQTREDAIKNVPEGHEYMEKGNFIWTRPKSNKPPVDPRDLVS